MAEVVTSSRKFDPVEKKIKKKITVFQTPFCEGGII